MHTKTRPARKNRWLCPRRVVVIRPPPPKTATTLENCLWQKNPSVARLWSNVKWKPYLTTCHRKVSNPTTSCSCSPMTKHTARRKRRKNRNGVVRTVKCLRTKRATSLWTKMSWWSKFAWQTLQSKLPVRNRIHPQRQHPLVTVQRRRKVEQRAFVTATWQLRNVTTITVSSARVRWNRMTNRWL